MIKESIILALDQSSSSTGYSVFQSDKLISYGTLSLKDITKKTHGETYYDEKVSNVKEFMIRCIDFFKPNLVIIEDIQQQTNVQTFKDLSYLQGILKNYLYENKVPFSVLKPSEWRKEIGIKGRGREILKKHALEFIKSEFNLDVCEDEAEAICIGKSGFTLHERNKLVILKDL